MTAIDDAIFGTRGAISLTLMFLMLTLLFQNGYPAKKFWCNYFVTVMAMDSALFWRVLKEGFSFDMMGDEHKDWLAGSDDKKQSNWCFRSKPSSKRRKSCLMAAS